MPTRDVFVSLTQIRENVDAFPDDITENSQIIGVTLTENAVGFRLAVDDAEDTETDP